MTTPTTMTPALAAYWLARRNPVVAAARPLDHSLLLRLTRHLRAGTWRPWSERDQPVVVRRGELWDGQHRLTAVISTGIPILVNLLVQD